jgi:hypothetical protein
MVSIAGAIEEKALASVFSAFSTTSLAAAASTNAGEPSDAVLSTRILGPCSETLISTSALAMPHAPTCHQNR